jgi:hypothetical protein
MQTENASIKQNPIVTAILLNYRDAVRSLACLQSLLVEGVEHVMVWDNSEDGWLSAAEIQRENLDEARVHSHL